VMGESSSVVPTASAAFANHGKGHVQGDGLH
jgi:hypothetical protein